MPLWAGEQGGEAFPDDLEHNVYRDRGARRGSEQRGDAASGIGDDLGAVVDNAGLTIRLLDGLHPNACVDQFPILSLCGRIENLQHLDAVPHALRALLDEVADKVEVMDANIDEGREVVRTNGEGQVGVAALLVQELRRPGGEGTEKQRFPAIQDAGVEVRHSHRRGRGERLTIDLCLVLLDDFRIVANEPLAADRETA